MTREEFFRWLLGDVVYDVVQLLKNADEWDCYLNTITHKSGLTVWVGNEAYGVAVHATMSYSPDDFVVAPVQIHKKNIWLHECSFISDRLKLFGGVTAFSCIGLSLRHRVLWHYASRVKYVVQSKWLRV